MTDHKPAAGFGKGVNDYLNAYVALADAKAAGFLAASLTVGAAVIGLHVEPLSASILRWIAVGWLAGAVGASAFVIFPRLPSGRRGVVFWEDIRGRPELDAYMRDVENLTDADVEKEYAAQNYFVSDVVHRKHLWVRRGILLFLAGVGFGVAAYIVN